MSGLARVFRGNTIAALENIPLWHERDISHSSTERIIFPDSTILLDYILTLFKDVISNIVVNKNNLKRNLELTNGLVFSQNVLLKLTEKKMSREQAYKIVQDVAMKCWKGNINFEKLLSEDTEVKKYLSESDFKEIFDYSKSKRNIDYIFKRLNL